MRLRRPGGPIIRPVIPLLIRLDVALTATLVSLTLAGCSGGSQSEVYSGPPTASSSPGAVTQASGSPFTGSLSGPDPAEAGQTITVTITNTGRLPNDFQLDFEPANAATATPQPASLAARQVSVALEMISGR